MKFARRVFAILALCIAVIGTAYAFNVPALTGRVNDYAGLLTQSQRVDLEDALRALEQKTTVQVAILTVRDMQGQDIKSFSLKVAETWKLGQKGKDNGLLVLYTVKEDGYRLEVGYGLEGAIPDGVAGDIIRHQLRAKADPKKGTRDFYGAFQDGVHKISSIVSAEYAKDPTGASMRRSSAPDEDTVLFVLIVAVVIAGVAGIIHAILGAIVGGGMGALVAASYSMGGLGFLVLIVLGILMGLIARVIVEAFLSGSGGSYGSSGGWSSSSSDSGGFSGGGGSFGGGGADG